MWSELVPPLDGGGLVALLSMQCNLSIMVTLGPTKSGCSREVTC